MKVSIIEEAGYNAAVLGLSISKGATQKRAEEVAQKLSSMDGGHNKVLESIFVWLDITAPRYWWQEADTYRMSTKQSESTMHTIQRRDLSQDDFEYHILSVTLDHVNFLIRRYRETKALHDLFAVKNELPEGFLQRRIWVVNYKCLRNVLLQRTTHRLEQWKYFCAYIRGHVEHPELLP